MKMTAFTRAMLAARRQRRALVRQGYEEVPCPIMAMHNGGRMRERIVDVKISTDGHGLYVLTDARRDLALMEAEYGPRTKRSIL
ncbi:hypothetical protein [Phreatobacter oligotrophus]|uniref:Uncharacterized protein n=1 Tax=Phreatobacter oligotrophus TaxID=1122261 RepID=A0A2T4ZIV0_9HYPH|nr:hypothetical protein [Phreatobacter oligotrophus]PTM61916.1 hypothetical protein C8P69_101589 [Phreatobacter oligotrophus]